MIGHSTIDDIYWPDAALQSVTATYEHIAVAVIDCNGKQIEVICLGHIGQRTIAFWDEVIVQSSRITDDHPFIAECMQAISKNYAQKIPDSGSLERNQVGKWLLWELLLADGASLQIVAKEFRVCNSSSS